MSSQANGLSVVIPEDQLSICMGAIAHCVERITDITCLSDRVRFEQSALADLLAKLLSSKQADSDHVVSSNEDLDRVLVTLRKFALDLNQADSGKRPSLGVMLIAKDMDMLSSIAPRVVNDLIRSLEYQAYGQTGPVWLEIWDPRVEDMKSQEVLGYHPSWVDERNPAGLRPCFWSAEEGEWKNGGLSKNSSSYSAFRCKPERVRKMPEGPALLN